jgi:hypothetical protein
MMRHGTLYRELSVLKEQLQSEEFDSFCALIIHLNADEVFLFFKLPYQKVSLPKRISTLP